MSASSALSASAKGEPISGSAFAGWLDQQTGRIMLLPAVLILLAFAIFPMILSAYLSTVRFALAPGGYKVTFIGWQNFKRLVVGAQQYHFLGTFKPLGAVLW